jgi:hypothetical protein
MGDKRERECKGGRGEFVRILEKESSEALEDSEALVQVLKNSRCQYWQCLTVLGRCVADQRG